jgi:hypothetical protein
MAIRRDLYTGDTCSLYCLRLQEQLGSIPFVGENVENRLSHHLGLLVRAGQRHQPAGARPPEIPRAALVPPFMCECGILLCECSLLLGLDRCRVCAAYRRKSVPLLPSSCRQRAAFSGKQNQLLPRQDGEPAAVPLSLNRPRCTFLRAGSALAAGATHGSRCDSGRLERLMCDVCDVPFCFGITL